jgi:hypothetical protein
MLTVRSAFDVAEWAQVRDRTGLTCPAVDADESGLSLTQDAAKLARLRACTSNRSRVSSVQILPKMSYAIGRRELLLSPASNQSSIQV